MSRLHRRLCLLLLLAWSATPALAQPLLGRNCIHGTWRNVSDRSSAAAMHLRFDPDGTLTTFVNGAPMTTTGYDVTPDVHPTTLVMESPANNIFGARIFPSSRLPIRTLTSNVLEYATPWGIVRYEKERSRRYYLVLYGTNAGNVGHAWMQLLNVEFTRNRNGGYDTSVNSVGIWGFYPVGESLTQRARAVFSEVPGALRNELEERENLLFTDQLMVEISASDQGRIISTYNRWSRELNNLTMSYQLFTNNCISFVAAIARAVQSHPLVIPGVEKKTTFPDDFVRAIHRLNSSRHLTFSQIMDPEGYRPCL